MPQLKELSTNPFEFIRQCKDNQFSTNQAIIDQSWMHGPEFSGRVAYLISKSGHVDSIFLQAQRAMVRDLATEMLRKTLYVQEQFAGKLIALMNEFGVGVAFVEYDRAYYGTVEVCTVTSYTPEGWGVQQSFTSDGYENPKAEAQSLAKQINSYGNFTL